jgi:hypothetical protein
MLKKMETVGEKLYFIFRETPIIYCKTTSGRQNSAITKDVPIALKKFNDEPNGWT